MEIWLQRIVSEFEKLIIYTIVNIGGLKLFPLHSSEESMVVTPLSGRIFCKDSVISSFINLFRNEYKRNSENVIDIL